MTLAAAVVDEVRRRLAARNMSQNELARQARIPSSLIHRTMNKERQLTLNELEAIAGALGLAPEYLVRVAINKGSPPDG